VRVRRHAATPPTPPPPPSLVRPGDGEPATIRKITACYQGNRYRLPFARSVQTIDSHEERGEDSICRWETSYSFINILNQTTFNFLDCSHFFHTLQLKPNTSISHVPLLLLLLVFCCESCDNCKCARLRPYFVRLSGG
jgi:hypothetical protein